MKLMFRSLALSILTLLISCSSADKRMTPAPVKGGESRAEAVPVKPKSEVEDIEVIAYRAPAPVSMEPVSAVVALLDESDRQLKAGEFNRASATLERALRIEPRNAHLWNRLAHVRLKQGRFAMAGDMAAKSNALSGENPDLQQDNWSIIASTRRATGDKVGAQAAERRAAAFR